jgi:hypothetical protein
MFSLDATTLAIWEDRHLLHLLEKKLSPRKHRLFVAGCCRLVWHLVPEGPCRQAVEAAEMFADGRVDAKQLRRARREAGAVRQVLEEEWDAASDTDRVSSTPETGAARHMAYARYSAANACAGAAIAESSFARGGGRDAAYEAWIAARKEQDYEARKAAEEVAHAMPSSDDWMAASRETAYYRIWSGTMRRQGEVLLDILGNLTGLGSVDPAWRAWNDGAVVKLAAAIYDKPGWPDLSVGADPDWSAWCALADALEQAGCTNLDLLYHLRGPGPHVRGCAALDLLLGLK